MRHGKYQSLKRHIPPAVWVILILAVLGMSIGGARAYLSASTDPVYNSFTADGHPTISVDEDYIVTVSNTNYAVYLRAAVVVNWDNDNNDTILAAKSDEYTLALGGDWKAHDGFYYYNKSVTNNESTTALITDLIGSKPGYTLKVDIAVQAIQAIGTVDDGNKTAVEAAWGITPDKIKSGTSS